MIKKELFGKLPCGCEVYAYTLSNGSITSACVLNYGGIIKNIWVKDKNGVEADVVCGFDNLEGYLTSGGYQGALIGRIGNRIGGAKFTLEGKEYELYKNDGNNSLHGGKDGFNQMMDSVFILPPIFDESYYRAVIHEIREMQIMNMGNYAHGNQPIQHMLYMYNYSGQPWKAQHWIREVMDKLYTPAPDGYCGDEDNGQTSAWYVFSAMGFYPVCPGTDEYVLGTPYFKEMKLHLENGKTVTISAPNNGDDKRYISSMTLNGKEYTKNYLTHQDLLNGASISFKMDAKPNQQRGTKESDFPYSFSNEFKKKK